MAEEALDARGLVEALNDDEGGDGSAKPLTINDLPKEIIVSVLVAANDLNWVRRTIPCVCKAWNELFLTKDASPLHETLEVNFYEEAKRASAARGGPDDDLEPFAYMLKHGRLPHRPGVHASRIISWAECRAGSVRKLRLDGGYAGNFDDFSPEDLGALVRVVGSSLTEISLGSGVDRLCAEPFWESLRDYVVPAGRLRSFSAKGIQSDTFNSRLGTLGRLAGGLEEVEVCNYCSRAPLPRFPEFFCRHTELRRLVLRGHSRIISLPAEISSLKKLEEITLDDCRLSSLPKELGELSGLTKLDLSRNETLGSTLPVDEAFPAELGKMKSLRVLDLSFCCLRAVPAFVGELESLEIFYLCDNDHLQIHAPLDFLVEGCPRLREVILCKSRNRVWDPASLERVEAFKAKLCAKNPGAEVLLYY